jgi:lysophospholipase L1-like esterase
MRKLMTYTFCGLYLFVLLGLVLHTSTHRTILGKYSAKYALLLLLTAGLFFFYRKAVIFLFSETTLKKQDGTTFTIPVLPKVVFCMVSFAACFWVAETILRVRGHEQYEKPFYSCHPFLQNSLNIRDSQLHVNSHGFRGEEITKTKPDGTYRIFVVGGSTVLCDKASYEQSHVRILEKLLQRHYQDTMKIEVMNAGNSWHTSEHSLIKYLFKIKDYDPDLIILWHAINDLYRSFAPQRLARREFQTDYSHFWGPFSNIIMEHFDAEAGFYPTITLHSHIGDRFVHVLKTWPYSDIRNAIQARRNREIDVFEFPSRASFTRNLTSLIHIMQDDRVELVLATQPFLYNTQLTQAEKQTIWFPQAFCINKDNEYPSLASMERGMNQFNSETKRIAALHDIPLIDLEPQVPKNHEYFLDDCHYTPKGNQRVAETIFEFVVGKNIIE